MSKLKVLTVVGTRPEIIRLSRVIAALDRETEHTLVHTGQNYDFELNQIFFDDLSIRKPDVFLEAVGATACETIGNVIAKVDPVLERIRPDAFLVLGDTNSCLSALPAKRRKVPVFHMEAGNRCFDDRVPEEINRRIVDHTADVNMPYSSIAREYLLREGLSPDRVIKTGSPMFEVLEHYRAKIEASKIVSTLGLVPGQYVVVSCHRDENVESELHLDGLVTGLERLAERTGRDIVFSMHPRTRKRLEATGKKLHPKVKTLKPLGFCDYNQLQKNAWVVLSDSGTITEESSILNFAAVNIREAHERPEGMEEASVVMSGLNPDHLLRAVELVTRQHKSAVRAFRLVEDYAMPNVSDKIVRIIHSYVPYVNRVVWQRPAIR